MHKEDFTETEKEGFFSIVRFLIDNDLYKSEAVLDIPKEAAPNCNGISGRITLEVKIKKEEVIFPDGSVRRTTYLGRLFRHYLYAIQRKLNVLIIKLGGRI